MEETFVWNLFQTGTSLRNILVEPDRVVGIDPQHGGPTILGRPQGDGEVDHRPDSAGQVSLFPGTLAPTDADEANEGGPVVD